MNIIKSFKNRKIDYSKPVYCYRNTHCKNEKVYSIKQGGRVVAHTRQIMLKDCEFIINEAGRKKVLETGKKFVHAYIKGEITPSGMGTDASDVLPAKIVYCPLHPVWPNNYFECWNLTRRPFRVTSAMIVILNQKGVSAAYVN
jgi:hypothetical protein